MDEGHRRSELRAGERTQRCIGVLNLFFAPPEALSPLPPIDGNRSVTPVVLPSGRAMLAIRPLASDRQRRRKRSEWWVFAPAPPWLPHSN
jgi:hypothetical protein